MFLGMIQEYSGGTGKPKYYPLQDNDVWKHVPIENHWWVAVNTIESISITVLDLFPALRLNLVAKGDIITLRILNFFSLLFFNNF